MKISTTQYARSLYELTLDKSQKDVDNVIVNFLRVLKKNRQLKLAKKIMEKFSAIYNQKNGIVEAEVTSRKELGGEVRTKVRTYVRTKYQAKEVVLNNKIDLNIKGGIVIKVGDEILDGSVVRQLQNLKNILAK